MTLRRLAATLSIGLAAACSTLVVPKAGPWNLLLQSGAGGTLEVSPTGTTCEGCEPGTTQFDDGTTVTITATPDSTHTFTGFTGDCSGTTCTLTMEADHSVGATFAPVPATVTVVSSGPGVVASAPGNIYCGANCVASFDEGSMVTLTAAPDANAVFAGWGGDCSGTDACTLTVDGAKNVTAAFTIQLDSVTVSKIGSGHGSVVSAPTGIDCGQTCSSSFDAGSLVVLTAVPDETSVFSGWTGDCSGTGACAITIDQVHTVTAQFDPATVALSVVTLGNGMVSSADSSISCGSTCQATYDVGTMVTLTPAPASGSMFAGFTGDCTGLTCMLTMNANHSVGATFVSVLTTLNVTTMGPGVVSSSPSGIYCGASCSGTFPQGSTVTLTPTANSDALFAGWGGDCSGTGPCMLTIDSTKNVTAMFTTQTDSITVTTTGSGHGTIVSDPNGITCGETCSASFSAGGVVVLSATPDATSVFSGWSGDCSGTGACIVTVDGAHAVTAQFDPATVALSVVTLGSGSVSSSDNEITCGNTCRASYDLGAMVTLTATPNSGYSFIGWSGACSGTSTCVVTLSSPQVVAAAFQPTSLTVLDTFLQNGPPTPTNQRSAEFWFSGTAPAVSFVCSLDAATPATCSSPATFTGLSDATHTFTVAAVDIANNVDPTPATYTWVVDTTPPRTSLTAQPSNPSNVNTPSFSFTSNEAGSTFVCGLDTGATARCTSPDTLPSLSDGTHTFTVAAIDSAGNADPFPPSYTWTVDTAPPAVTITSQPSNPSNNPAPSFSFTSSKSGSTFACALDTASPSACTSPTAYSSVGMGPHTFSVVATDLAGNVSAAASWTWTVNLAIPTATITQQPANPTNAPNATFAFTSSASSSTFTCKVDAQVYIACDSPVQYGGFSSGSHTFSVIATDPSNNVSLPATVTWTVDTTPPVATITSKPANPTNATASSFSFTSSKAGSTFMCSLDGTAATCTSPTSYMGFSSASHTFAVVATDPAGNISQPATYTWTVNTTPPTVTISSFPPNPTHIIAPSFAFSSSESGSTFTCQLDSNAAASCTSPKAYVGMSNGSHTFSVVATDLAGNVSQPATYTWTVNTTALAPPTPITATAGNGQVTISWTAVTEAQTYTVYYGTTPAFGSSRTGLTGTSLTLTGLTNCGTYYFTVTDIDPSGNECGQPPAVTASPAPIAPTLTASGSTGSIALSWTSVPGASTYSVYYGTTSGGPYTGANAVNGVSPFTVSGTSATLSGLPPYSPAFITVAATEGTCTGPMSAQVASAPIPWLSLNPGPTNNSLYGISCAPGAFPCVALGAQGTALSTTDGVTWSGDYSATTGQFATVHMVTAQVGYAIAGTTVYKTANGGTSWLATTAITPAPTAIYEVAFSSATTGFVAESSGNVALTTNGGTSWTVVNTGTLANLYGAYISPDATVAIVVGQQGVTLRSTNGGTTWGNETQPVTSDLEAVTCSSDTNCWAVGTSGVVLVSSTGGGSWTPQTSGTTGTIHRVGFANNSTGWLTSDNGFIAGTTTGGSTWTSQTSGETGSIYGLAVKSATDIYFAGANGILRHSADGSTWNSLRVVLTTTQLNRVHAFNSSNVIVIGNTGTILQTSNGGASWTTAPPPTSQNLNAMAWPDATHGFIVGNNGVILQTSNGGSTWNTQTSGSTASLAAIQCLSDTMCWAAGGTFLLSTTDGMTWSSTNLASATVNQGILSLAFSDATHGVLGLNCSASTATNIVRTTDGVVWSNSSFDASGGQGTNGGFGPVTSIYMQSASNIYLLDNSLGWEYQSVVDSTNFGGSWSAPYDSRNFNGNEFMDLAVGSGLFAVAQLATASNTVLMSTDGQNWRTSQTGINTNLRGIAIADSETVYTVGDNGVILKTTTAGN